MDADTSNKVGFRPYHQTDAFGAAHLSGLGQNHPFKPQAWHLHGVDGTFLGTYHLNRPFDPWELYSDVHATAGVHGLGYFGQDAPETPPEFFADPKHQAADELHAAGHITQAEHDAILEGSMSFQDVLGYDPTDQSSWLDAVGWMRDWNQKLQSLEHDFQAAGPQPGNAAFIQLGQQLMQQRQHYTDLASQFVRYYTLVMGSTPSGLSGLGFAPVAIVAGAFILFVTLYIGYQAFLTWQQSVNVDQIKSQTAQQSAATDQQLADQLKRAQDAGDTVTANAILATMKQRAISTTPSGSAEQWLMSNAKWIGLFGLGIVVAGPIAQGLFGRRR